jgi:anti-sigma B factor antagonist
MSDQQVTSISRRDDVVVAVVEQAEMDEVATGKMQAEVLAGAEQAKELPVVLDLSKVSFFPSLSLGAVVVLLNTLKKKGQKLILVGLQPPVREALAVTRLDKLFEIRDDVEEVLAHQRRSDAAASE